MSMRPSRWAELVGALVIAGCASTPAPDSGQAAAPPTARLQKSFDYTDPGSGVMESWHSQFEQLLDPAGRDYGSATSPIAKLLAIGSPGRDIPSDTPLRGRLTCFYSPPQGPAFVATTRDVVLNVPAGAKVTVGMVRDPQLRTACRPLYNIEAASGEKLYTEFVLVQTQGHGIDTRPVP